MTYYSYKHKNNASTLMVGAISAGATSCICTATEGALFPSSGTFLLTLEAWSGGVVTKREIVSATRSSDTFTIARSAGYCPANDSAVTQTNTAFSFDPTSETVTIKLKVTAEDFDDINGELARIVGTEIPLLLPKSTYNAEKQLFSASSAGDDDYEITSADVTSYVNGQTFKVQADVANTGPATLKLNALTAKPIEKLSGGAFTALATGDIIANQIFWATYNSVEDCFQFSVDPATAGATVADADETTKGISERATNTEAGDFADITRFINSLQLGLFTRCVEQDIPYAVGAVSQNASLVKLQSTIDGSELFIAFPNAASTQATIFRLARENSNGHYAITHRTTFSPVSGVDNLFVCPIGDYLYFGYSDGGTKKMQRYAKADLSGVSAMTISGTNWTAGGNAFTDGTNMYVFDSNPDVIRKYTISGTTITNDSTITYTSAGNMGTAGSVVCDGTSVWAVGAQANATVIRKYALAGGAASSSTTRYLYYDVYTNYSPIRLFIPKKGVLGLAYGKSTYDQTNHLGSSLKIQATIQP